LRVLFLARSLGYGGAERQLVELARALSKRGLEILVACFYDPGPLAEELRHAGVDVVSLGKRGRWDTRRFLRSLVSLVGRTRPDILHSYLPEPNLVAASLKLRYPRQRIVWGVRASNMDFAEYGFVSRLSFAATIAMSRIPELIIANSVAGATYHVSRGYPADRLQVIPNGVDTSRFRPDPIRREGLRRALGVDAASLLIGHVGRIDVMKDHATLLRAAQRFASEDSSARFLCVGTGSAAYEHEIRALSEHLGLSRILTWMPPRPDTESVYNACDVVTSSSAFGEGFPNVIAEAMACGVPCVVTDVGDSRLVVGEDGLTVPPKRPDLLAQAWSGLFGQLSESLSARCRNRIVENFSVDRLTQSTIVALERALGA
jgi:glycosyltransferase involved in cell wall biosynthesis